MIIAIDGPAGSGKSTVAREVARRLGFTYLDSGAMYRAVTLAALDSGTDLDDGPALGHIAERLGIELRRRDDDNAQVFVDGRDVSDEIREPRVTGASSRVAAHPDVRRAMLDTPRSSSVTCSTRHVRPRRCARPTTRS
jgi:CMP/dCMP kinase